MHIKIEKLCKSYGDKIVLNNYSNEIEYGKCTVIMGASGCGKTTLLSVLLGLTKPDSGTVTGLPECVSAVFQENRLCEEFSAYENVALVLSNGIAKNKVKTEKIEAAFDAVGMKEFMDTPVSDLSGGQKRRVAILRALIYDADLYILDEPFSGLDEDSKKTVMDYVKKITNKKTVLIVTHDNDEAKYMADKIYEM